MEVGPLPDDDGPSVRLITVESFDMFFRREYPRLVTLAYALSGSRELAEDAAQQAFGGYQVGPLDLPTFLALGRYEYMIPFYLWDRSKQHLSNLRYKLYEKSGHHPPYEQPDEFAADLLEWARDL
jgi:pimeloyl-ACP methyl ester carboxylesterase